MAENSTSCRMPVVDFSAFSITHEEVPDANNPTVQQLVRDLHSACSTLGFVYLTNHGIPQEEVLIMRLITHYSKSWYVFLESENQSILVSRYGFVNRHFALWSHFNIIPLPQYTLARVLLFS